MASLSACEQGGDAGDGLSLSPLIITGGDIITLDDTQKNPEAIVIYQGKITAMGKRATLFKQYPRARIMDIKGQTIVPGFIDSHVHVRELGMDRVKANLVGVTNVGQMIERLKAHYPNPEDGTWLLGQGWDEGAFATNGYPDRAALDAAFPRNPIKLESLHGFAGFYNARALEIADIGDNTSDPDVGQILRRADGGATGVLLTLAQDLVNRHVPAITMDMRKAAIIAGLQTMADAGVTSIHEAGMEAQDVEAFNQLRAEGNLPIRVYGMLNGNDNALMTSWFEKGPLTDEADMFTVRGIKVFYDGSLGSRTALMKEPYSDKPEAANPTERITPTAVVALANNAVKFGFQMAVHAIGDEGNNRTLNIYEAALKNYPNFDHRWRIEHAQVVLPDYYERAAKLGVLSSMQSSHAVGDSKWAEDRVGPDRIKHAYAWQKILNAGGHLMMNSDLPGEPWTPVETLYFAVNRMDLTGNPRGGWYSQDALSAPEALRAMTIEGSYGSFQEDRIGSLSVGKWADFTLLSANPLTLHPIELRTLKPRGTWVAGKLVSR
jgi:hypothetical protein